MLYSKHPPLSAIGRGHWKQCPFSCFNHYPPRQRKFLQPRSNHEPTILRVEYKNDTISTKPSCINDSPNQTAIQPHSNLNQKNWRKIVRSESFASEVKSDSREIAAGAVERAPEIRGLVVGVVQDDG